MTEVIAKPFREAHADLFECLPVYQAQFRDSLPLLIMLGKLDQCITHVLDGRILFIAGRVDAAPGVAEVFLYPSIYALQYPKVFFREVKWWVDHFRQQYRRLQCWGEDTELSKRWLKHLGFLHEGTLHNYTSDGSMTIWGLV